MENCDIGYRGCRGHKQWALLVFAPVSLPKCDFFSSSKTDAVVKKILRKVWITIEDM
jgi:hypothetical protein